MKVILIAGSKGGSGRSTLAINLAYCLAQEYKVCTSDIDVQGSLTKFKDITPIEVVSLDDVLKGKIKGFDVALIDCPPYLTNKLPEIIKASDFVLVPVKSGFFDAVAVKDTLAMLKGKNHGIVLTMVQNRTSMTKEIIDILSEYGSPILNQQISQRVSYARSPVTGSVFSSDDEKAKEEITSLTIEIFSKI
jgi:chromosome partitioning protein